MTIRKAVKCVREYLYMPSQEDHPRCVGLGQRNCLQIAHLELYRYDMHFTRRLSTNPFGPELAYTMRKALDIKEQTCSVAPFSRQMESELS